MRQGKWQLVLDGPLRHHPHHVDASRIERGKCGLADGGRVYLGEAEECAINRRALSYMVAFIRIVEIQKIKTLL